jgi:uncharacterized protein (TIGR03435 family)
VQGATLSAVPELLTRHSKKPVVDRTGITGQFPMFVYCGIPDDSGVISKPDIITAFEKQLGLKLEPRKPQWKRW